VPPFPKLRIRALDDLARQLRFAPRETLRRQLERAESLATEIDPALAYPEDWIVFRVTGYRPDLRAPIAFPGEALLADMSALIERLSAGAGLEQRELPPGRHLDLQGVCGRWKVSRKTVERWRREGLVALRVKGASGKPRLVFPLESVERFERTRPERIRDAAGYTRMGPDLEERMLRRAAAYARLGCTRNQAAARIARRYGRALETVRQLLKRHDTGAAPPLFAQRGPPTPRERELIARWHWHGIEPGEMARRLGRSSPSVHRVINDGRAERLRTIAGLLGGESGKGTEKALGAESATSGLGNPGETDLLDFVRAARQGGVVLGVVERTRATAYRGLLARAAAGIAALPAHAPGATVLDRIETDLRWAARLKAELVRSHLPLLVRTLEGAIGRELEQVRSGLLGPLVARAIAALAEAVDAFEPGKGGRLAAPSGLAVTRVGAKFVREHGTELGGGSGRVRAASVLTPGTPLPDWTRRIAPWQQFTGRLWLEPDRRLRAGLVLRPERERRLLSMRFGWAGAARTLEEAAAACGLTVMQAGSLERSAARAAIAAGSGA
jgi:RNA polymerase primary sigma factor